MANVIFQARVRGALSLLLAATALTACNRDKILHVTDPDIIKPSNLGSAEAAEALRVGALTRISDVTGGLQPTSQGAGDHWVRGSFISVVSLRMNGDRQTRSFNVTRQIRVR